MLHNFNRKSFKWMSVAYSSKNLGFSIFLFKDLFLYSAVDDLLSDCRHFGIRYDESNGLLYFLKGTFNVKRENVSFAVLCLIGVTLTFLFCFSQRLDTSRS